MTAMSSRQRRREERINRAAFSIESFGYPLGLSLISANTIMPLLLMRLGASNLVIGLVPALASLGVFVPGIFVAPRLDSVPKKKKVVGILGFTERLFLLSIAGIITAWGVASPRVAMILTLVAWTLSNISAGMGLPAYFSVMAKCIPAEGRASIFGLAGALSGVVGVGAAELAGIILSDMPFPRNFAVLYIAAPVIMGLTLLPIAWAREPADPKPAARITVSEYMREASSRAKHDRSYAWAIAALAVMSFSLTAAAFYSTYAVRSFDASTRAVGRFTAIAVGGSVVAMPTLGRLADKYGNKLSMVITGLCFAGAAGLALTAHSVAGMYPVLFLASIGTSGISVNHNLMLAEFAPSHRFVPMYTSYSWLILSPFRIAAPILAGFVSDTLGFPVMFRIAMIAGAVAAGILVFAVKEPRERRYEDVDGGTLD